VIVGEWEWTKSVMTGRIGTIIQTPESEGLTRRYVFSRDRSMRIIETGSVVQDSEFRIVPSVGSSVNDDDLWLEMTKTDGTVGMVGISFRIDTLLLYNRSLASNSYYIRK